MKPVKAWAVVDKRGDMLLSQGPDRLWLNTVYDSRYNAVRSGRAADRIPNVGPCTVVRVEIREVPKKAKVHDAR